MKPIKKLLIIIATACLALVICWGVVFAMDYNSCQNLQIPRFIISTGKTADSGSGLYRGLGYTVEIKTYTDADSVTPVVESAKMSMFGKVIAASTA